MTPPFLVHILSALKKSFLRLARRSASLFLFLLSSLCRFTTRRHSKPGNGRLTAQLRLSNGALSRPLEGDIAGEDVPICASLLPPMGLEAAGEPPSPSDDPYSGAHSRHSQPLQEGTVIPPLEANPTTTEHLSVPETDSLHRGSIESLHLSLQMGESSVNHRRFLEDPLQESSSPGGTQMFLSETNQTTTGYVGATDSGAAEIIRPGSPSRSLSSTRENSMVYRVHRGPVHSRPVSVHSSIRDLHHGSMDAIPVPLDPPGLDLHVHYTAPPGSDIMMQSVSEVVMVYDGPLTRVLVAEEVRQHERYIPRASVPSRITVPAMTVKFPTHNVTIPPGWTKLVHPQGSRYFVHKENRTFTQMNICNEEKCEDIEYYMQYLLDELRHVIAQRSLDLDMEEVDLVIEPKVLDDCSVICCYYFATHRDRCLFWLDDFDTKSILSDCNGVENLSQTRLAIQAQSWKHCDYFPCLCPVTQDLVDEVRDMLIYAQCDHLSSRQSTAPFDVTEIREYLSIVDSIKVYPSTDRSMQRCHAAIVIGRIMYAFSRNHFINSHGESSVRHSFEQTVHPYTPSPLVIVLAPFLFFDPVVLVRDMHATFVDNMPSSERWNAFNLKLSAQFQDTNLQATVLLGANVGFLAINSIDVSGRSPTQVASYMSLVASLGSMIIGLLLVSHARTLSQGTVLQGEVFLSGLGEKERRLERLAIIYSLPKTLLMWGMIFFFAAFSINWWGPGDTPSRAVVGFVILVALLMISFAIIRTSGRGDRWWRKTKLIGLELSSRLADAGKRFMQLWCSAA
ncbi:hypothetical protein DFH29DRAFT_953418 [Suillus ampliporus]|nr:hypothetical protein DFH29DRAFT_953418 [Suillus ampliporus]